MTDGKKPTGIKARGFGSMSPEKRRKIAAMGGASVAPENRSFSRNRELASEAGAKGGQAVPDRKRTFTRFPEIAVEAGKRGWVIRRNKSKPKPD